MVEVPDDLGKELVNLLYIRTNLGYSSCSKNLIEIFDHISHKLPSLKHVSDTIIKSINKSVVDQDNPDRIKLNENLEILNYCKNDLINGEKNFYELTKPISKSLKILTDIRIQLSPETYKNTVVDNRENILSLVDIWRISTNKVIEVKAAIINFLCDCLLCDANLASALFDHTNLIEEICFFIKESIELKNYEILPILCKFLLYIITNAQQLTLSFKNFLNNDNFIHVIMGFIENDENCMKEVRLFDKPICERVTKEDTIQDLLIYLLISINNHYLLPNENVQINSIIANNTHCYKLLEKLLLLFNFEEEPLKEFRLTGINNEHFIVNSVIKYFSDLYSSSQTANLLYINDFYVILDIIIRKLQNLDSNDQARLEYISLIDLIIRNSNYIEHKYRIDELKQCFEMILSEKNETVDQDIVRLLKAGYPQFN